jgi:hypothetical protein
LFVASVACLAWRSAGRKSCIPLTAGAAVGAFAAVVVFEPSSPERLLPVLPFLLIALSAGWSSSWKWAPLIRAGIAAFALLLVVLNLPSFEWQHSAEHQHALSQMDDFREHAKPADVMLVMTASEPVLRLVERPFDPANRLGLIRCYWVLDPIDKDAAAWHRTVAHRVLETWHSGHDVWVSKSAFSDRPQPSSLWVEGDNPAVHWRDVPAFFRSLELDAETSPGFALIRQSPANRERLAHE